MKSANTATRARATAVPPSSTRERLVEYLRTREPVTAYEMSQALSIRQSEVERALRSDRSFTRERHRWTLSPKARRAARRAQEPHGATNGLHATVHAPPRELDQRSA